MQNSNLNKGQHFKCLNKPKWWYFYKDAFDAVSIDTVQPLSSIPLGQSGHICNSHSTFLCCAYFSHLLYSTYLYPFATAQFLNSKVLYFTHRVYYGGLLRWNALCVHRRTCCRKSFEFGEAFVRKRRRCRTFVLCEYILECIGCRLVLTEVEVCIVEWSFW